jgi:hypothetical protein
MLHMLGANTREQHGQWRLGFSVAEGAEDPCGLCGRGREQAQ